MYAAAMAALADSDRTRLVLVARAQESTVAEIARTHRELAEIGLTRQHVVINAVLPAPPDDSDPLANAIRRREEAAIATLPAELSNLPRDQVELKTTTMVGVNALATLFTTEEPTPTAAAILPLDQLTEAPLVALVGRGHPVHLTTTDPAGHLTDSLGGTLENLQVSSIDPAEATRTYRDRVMATKGAKLDEQGRAMLAEDLLSPCTEEVAVFQAFSRVISQSR